MRKMLAISWRELYSRFSDRTLLIILLLAPVGISTVVGLAFGGLSSGASPVEHIPVLVINQDTGSEQTGNLGETLSTLLVEGALPTSETEQLAECPEPQASADQGQSLDELIDGEILDQGLAASLMADGLGDEGAPISGTLSMSEIGRQAVDRGFYTALVVIPADYSSSMMALTDPRSEIERVQVEVYVNRGRMLAAGIVRSVVEGITSQMVSGNIAIGTTLTQLIASNPELMMAMDQRTINQLFACAFMPSADLIRLDVEPVETAAEANPAGGILVAVGSAQGMFFALFTGQFGILSLYEERKNWTLQRLVSTPTPRWAILGGKLLGVIASILFQLVLLMLAMTVIGSLMAGKLVFIWGDDFGRLALLLLAVAAAVGGLGMLIAGLMRSVEQANIFVTVINIALGVLGGTFGFTLPVQVAGISMIHWGRQAFELLAAGQTDIGLNLIILFGQGVILFGLGLIIFSRRFEVT